MNHEIREEIAKAIVDFEARRDKKDRLRVYELPAGDGGGSYEIAGINNRYHPHEAAKLKAMIEAGRHAEAEERVTEYIATYTDAAAVWHPNLGIQAFLRDCVFNRGARGAAMILQRAAGLPPMQIDGRIGPISRAAIRQHQAGALLVRLRMAREWYERAKVGRDERSPFWNGLANRWTKAVALATRYINMEELWQSRAV